SDSFHRHVRQFIVGTVFVALFCGVMWGFTGFANFGTLRDSGGTIITNRNAMAAQFAAAGFMALAPMPKSLSRTEISRPFLISFIILMISVVLTASRGGFLTLFTSSFASWLSGVRSLAPKIAVVLTLVAGWSLLP